MEQLLITGNKRLKGEVNISGAKNAAVALVPAALLVDDICVIENLPDIEDIRNMVNALNNMGVVCEFTNKNVLKIDSRNIKTYDANFDSVKKIRASYYLLGALLGRYKEAYVPLPGGCNFGDRPIDQHIKGFEALGATVTIEHGVIKAKADKLVGTTVYFDVISVGATINVMLAAVYAEGVTIIENAAKEPHIVDTANFLNKLGAKIKGAGTDTIKITGVKVGDLKGSEYTTIPDQIEAGTYMIMAASTGGDVTVTNIIPKHLESITAKLIEMGCKVYENESSVRVVADKPLKAVNVKTLVYPGFPTDMQPQMLALLCTAEGRGRVNETVWESRYQYVRELNRLGANITVNGNIADVEGVPKLSGTEVTATDLRAGAALVIGGLSAEGETTINNLELIDRGYENIEQKLTALGADIRRVKKTKDCE